LRLGRRLADDALFGLEAEIAKLGRADDGVARAAVLRLRSRRDAQREGAEAANQQAPHAVRHLFRRPRYDRILRPPAHISAKTQGFNGESMSGR
jgi:hypothetical protein